MTKQLGPVPGADFPDKSLRTALVKYLTTLEADQKALLAIENILVNEDVGPDQLTSSINGLKVIERDFQEILEFLNNSKPAQSILPYRYRLLLSLEHAEERVQRLVILMNSLQLVYKQNQQKQKISMSWFREILMLLNDTMQEIESIRYTLELGFSRPLYPKAPHGYS